MNTTNALIYTYTIYVVLSLILTVWVATTLHRHGRIFLVSSFKGNETLADSVNHLLVVGFYLVNLGFVAKYLKQTGMVVAPYEVFEAVAAKMGTVLLVLGAMHFLNIYIFNRIRRRSEEETMAPPVHPDFMMPKQILPTAPLAEGGLPAPSLTPPPVN